IEALSRAVSSLTEEVRSIKNSQSKPLDDISQSTQYNRIISPPETEVGYYRRAQSVLDDMNEEQYKNFHDEVVQILNGLDDTLQLDHTKRWTKIAQHVTKKMMKEIDKAMKGRFQYKDTELKWVLQQLHRHRRENWKVNLDPEKVKSEKKRKGTNSRRGDVSNL
ncbi:hypothetical protein RhiirA4_483549, partial [Rhizophagus irregularis]